MSGLVYSYTRFSDPRQAAGHSAERQMAYAEKWAAEHGLMLDESLSLKDEGLSAYHQHHVKSGALGAFLAAVESGRIAPGSVLVVEGLDRLSRAEPIQAQAQLAQIVNAGITVVTASDGKAYSREHLKSNPMDLVYSLLVMIRAHEESDTKSKRVTASIRRMCEGWMAGTYRGVIRNGKDPMWVKRTAPDAPANWDLIPEQVDAIRHAVDLYMRGYGSNRLISEVAQTGAGIKSRVQIYRLVKQRALIGEKELTIDGVEYRLPGYYPAILGADEWSNLQSFTEQRGRRRTKGEIPHVVTGIGITKCGYCGFAMVGQNMGTKTRMPDGRVKDHHRRLLCTRKGNSAPCPVQGSTNVARVERALMAYCSDQFNLSALYGGDRAAGPRAALTRARAELSQIDDKLKRLMAMLEDDDGAPATLIKRMRELELQQTIAASQVSSAERALAAVARTDLQGADAIWRSLANGVEMQDYDARVRARQLVADTFEHIVIYHRGIEPDTTPKWTSDILLVAKGGTSRLLRIGRHGELLSADDVDDLPEPSPSA